MKRTTGVDRLTRYRAVREAQASLQAAQAERARSDAASQLERADGVVAALAAAEQQMKAGCQLDLARYQTLIEGADCALAVRRDAQAALDLQSDQLEQARRRVELAMRERKAAESLRSRRAVQLQRAAELREFDRAAELWLSTRTRSR